MIMGNPRTRAPKPSNSGPAVPKTYKFADFQKEADKTRAKLGPRPELPPFIIDDVTPRIEITAPDTLERMLMLADFMGAWESGHWDLSQTTPLLRALTGDQFGRVWSMVRNDPDPAILTPLINAMFDHFSSVINEVREAEELPGGSEDSSA